MRKAAQEARSQCTLTKNDQALFSSEALQAGPLISIILPVFNPPIDLLALAIQSVMNQTYDRWELCVVDDASSDPRVRSFLESAAQEEPRIKLHLRQKNGHIAAASNDALALATGEYIALLDQDDELASVALGCVARAIIENPSVDWLYTDEEKITVSGDTQEIVCKPAYSPELLLSYMYTGHLSIYRRNVVQSLGGFRLGVDGAQDFDLALRMSEFVSNVQHIPRVLYRWRMHEGSVAGNRYAKPYAYDNGARVLCDHLARREVPLIAEQHPTTRGVYVLRSEANTSSSVVQICVVVVGGTAHVQTVDSCLAQAVRERLHHDPRVVSWDMLRDRDAGEKTFHDLVAPCVAVDCRYVVFMHENLVFDSPEDLERLLHPLRIPGVSAVSPKIVSSKRILSGGVVTVGEHVEHLYYGTSRLAAGYGGRLVAMHNCSTISPYCFAIQRSALGAYGRSISASKNWDHAVFQLSSEMQRASGRIVFNPNATVQWRTGRFRQSHSGQPGGNERDPYYPAGLCAQRTDFAFNVPGTR